MNYKVSHVIKKQEKLNFVRNIDDWIMKIKHITTWKGKKMRDLTPYDVQFEKVVNIIKSAKERAYRKVNEELILMYRDIGEYISVQSENAEYGDAFVQKLADFFATNYPELKGFNHRGLYRMKQFYELYKDNEKVSPLVTQLS